ncbi:MAG: hypothetical protein EXS43_13960 [Opitutus sp.]|nr:hypothetical protein [Opitutus sp.]
MMTSAAGRVWPRVVLFPLLGAIAGLGLRAQPGAPLRILPLGDSITRGSYIARYETGPRQGQAVSLPNPEGAGWRKLLQDRLRAAGVLFDFVGELNNNAYGRDGVVDPAFDPDHHGLAGFGNRRMMTGGTVPTLPDTLAALGVKEVVVPDLPAVLRKHKPDVILLMSGANGFDAPARDELIRLIGASSVAHLFVATILPQRPPRADWDQVDAYNASLPAIVAAQQATGHRVTLVEMKRALSAEEDLLADGVHPSPSGMAKMAARWFQALQAAGYVNRPSSDRLSNSATLP